jgi:hypothetical protein
VSASSPNASWTSLKYYVVKYIPDWFPGAGFKQFAANTRRLHEQMREAPFKRTREEMVRVNAERVRFEFDQGVGLWYSTGLYCPEDARRRRQGRR